MMTFSAKHKKRIILYLCFTALLALNVGAWLMARAEKPQWLNVPPPPGYNQALISSLGDAQLAYRTTAFMLQNLGSTGGDVRNMNEYNYDYLAKWFFLSARLDLESSVVPHLAVYYYTDATNPNRLRKIMPYIYYMGTLGRDNDWRWLAQGVFVAQYKIKDLDLAAKFADKMAKMAEHDPKMPLWTKQMPAFVRYAQGEKEAAYDILKQLLISGKDTLPADELFLMRRYICKKLLDEKESRDDPLCQNR